MSLHGLALFCLIYSLATATPGPAVGAVIARVLGRGAQGIGAVIAGFVLGDLVWFTLAATGMAVLARTVHSAFIVIKFVGAAYLLYLAIRLWTGPVGTIGVSSDSSRPDGLRSFLGGLTLTLGNPKVMVFFLALLPTVVELERLSFVNFLEVAAAICIILTSVMSFYAIATLRARRLFKNSRAILWLNRGTGTMMAGAAVTVAMQ